MSDQSGEPDTFTPRHVIRVAGDVWAPAKARAKAEGTSISAVIRGWLIDYVNTDPERRADRNAQ
jgi:hypothetical protein